ncbi:MAG: tetratricopeptide repeat protein [Bacteroidetes bacterium]|nr:tetratricopeptide repeat protein [Bacteroidota bacterium]MBK9542443.1 tetratricopeptide repeat protein [Bacteroidota bacterium]
MKLKLIILLLLVSLQSWSQNFNVQSASNSLTNKDLPGAKKFIDMAAEHESTANSPKMWYYMGKVYLEIYEDSTSKANGLDPDAIEKSAKGFLNCLKTDTKASYTDEVNKLVWIPGIGLFNNAIAAYTKGETEKSTRLNMLVLDILPLDKDNNLKRNNITTEIVYRNLYFNAIKAKDNEKAKSYLTKLMEMKFNDPKIYLYMSRIQMEEKDTTKAIESIAKGRALYDENPTLMNEEIRLYILTGRTEELISKLNASIETTPDNENLYFTRASLYEGKKDYEKAIADYKKTIELNPDLLYANYNLGVIYFNQGADKANAANSLKSNEEFEKAKKVYEEKFNLGAPYLEKALELNPKKSEDDQSLNKSILQILKQLYARTNQTEKYNAIKAKIEAK